MKCNDCGRIIHMMYGGLCFECAMDKKDWPKKLSLTEDEYFFRLTWPETQMIIDMFDDHNSDISEKLSMQLLYYAQPQSSTQTANKEVN